MRRRAPDWMVAALDTFYLRVEWEWLRIVMERFLWGSPLRKEEK